MVAVLCSALATTIGDGRPSDAAAPSITLEIVSDEPGDLTVGAAFVHASGGRILSETPGLLLVTMPVDARDRLASMLTDGDVRAPVPVDVRPQGMPFTPEAFGPTTGSHVGITNADAWHAAGIDGTGVKIGVVDFFDVTRYWDEDEHGPTPIAGVDALCLDSGTDCTDEFFDGDDRGGEDHGVAVVEIIRDMAPGADIFLGQAATVADYQTLVAWFAANGVQIVNRSLGSRFDGPGDGRGLLDDVVAGAVERGILWVNSGGNNAAGRYYREPVRLIGDRVAFGPAGTSTFLPFRGCAALGGVRWANDWDKPPAERTDYDVFLWESPTGDPAAGSIIDASTRDQRQGADPVETQIGAFCPDAGASLYLEVRWFGGDIDGDVLEILDYGAGIAEFTQRTHSAAVSVVDSRERGVIGVGAIDPPQSGRVADYSAQGPTNDGRVAPQVTAPAGLVSTVFGTFSGTSASAPVVAGGAALLIDADLATAPNPLGDLIRNTTVDRGAGGPDNVYGYGEFRLPAPPTDAGLDQTPSRFVPLDVPTRFLDTRPQTAIGPDELIGQLWRGEILDLPVLGVTGIPSTGVTAVAVNVASVDPTRPSYVQALPTRQASLGAYANLNIDTPGQSRSNFSIIPVGDDGSVSLYSIADGHLVVDVLGWFEATDGPVRAGRFVELGRAERLLDTRVDAPAGPLASGRVRSVPMPVGVPAAEVDALVVTVVGVSPTARGWLQAFPAARNDVVAKTATINLVAGSNAANTAIVPVDRSGMAVTGRFRDNGTAHVVVDAIGYITSDTSAEETSGRFVPVRPNRAFDSRATTGPLDDGEIIVVDASAASGVAVPDDATGVVWNLVMVGADRSGYLRGWAADQAEPAISSLNWRLPGETRAAAAVTAVDRGRARFRVEDGTVDAPNPIGDVVADVFGYFT